MQVLLNLISHTDRHSIKRPKKCTSSAMKTNRHEICLRCCALLYRLGSADSTHQKVGEMRYFLWMLFVMMVILMITVYLRWPQMSCTPLSFRVQVRLFKPSDKSTKFTIRFAVATAVVLVLVVF